MKMFDADKTRMIGLPYGEKKLRQYVSRFHPIPERHGQTDIRTDIIAISISRVNVLVRDKNYSNRASDYDYYFSRYIFHLFTYLCNNCCIWTRVEIYGVRDTQDSKTIIQ